MCLLCSGLPLIPGFKFAEIQYRTLPGVAGPDGGPHLSGILGLCQLRGSSQGLLSRFLWVQSLGIELRTAPVAPILLSKDGLIDAHTSLFCMKFACVGLIASASPSSCAPTNNICRRCTSGFDMVSSAEPFQVLAGAALYQHGATGQIFQ